jgi:hypothetical protein
LKIPSVMMTDRKIGIMPNTTTWRLFRGDRRWYLIYAYNLEVFAHISVDIVFPILPRWFTQALRLRPIRPTPVRNYPDGTTYPQTSSSSPNLSPPTTKSENPPHDHALLESLFTSIYENRFINLKPSCKQLFKKKL